MPPSGADRKAKSRLRISQAAIESVEQAALYALFVVIITLLDGLQRLAGYAAPRPLDVVLQWLPGVALVLLAAEVVIQTAIRVVFDGVDRVRERMGRDRTDQHKILEALERHRQSAVVRGRVFSDGDEGSEE